MKVAAYTGGLRVPSARFRVRQYVDALRRLGLEIVEFASRTGSYPPEGAYARARWGILALAERLPEALRSYRYDLTLLQREFLSTLVTLEPLTASPRILDVDDAIWLHRGGRAAHKLARMCDRVICGNNYLAEWFGTINANVTVLPTAVDTDHFLPAPHNRGSSAPLVIGWIGTSGNLGYLRNIEPALARILRARAAARILVVCDRAPDLASLDQSRIEYHPWTEAGEVAAIQSMDVGIMPLIDSPWTRGKCSFKMLQYMSCGLPCVVSPVGMNAEILRMGHVAIGAGAESEWVDSIVGLLDDARLRDGLGKSARLLAEAHFSVHALAPKFAACLRMIRK